MRRILVLGAGKIGTLIAVWLAHSGRYGVCLADHSATVLAQLRDKTVHPALDTVNLDVADTGALGRLVDRGRFNAMVSCLPHYLTRQTMQLAIGKGLAWFDLCEDIRVARAIRQAARGVAQPVVPQCGLAPGFISTVAQATMQGFDSIDCVKLRVGALPLHPGNALKYSLTWSTDGLINEYANECQAIEEKRVVTARPLEGYETIQLEGMLYEAFNTSGGIGSLAETWAGRVRSMNYKTLRYPGHCKKMRFLMHDLRLAEDHATLKRILEHALPKTLQDVVLIYVAVTGQREGDFFEQNSFRRIYPQHVAGHRWSAIQVSTAAGLCAVLDIILTEPGRWRGWVRPEDLRLGEILANPFGRCLAGVSTPHADIPHISHPPLSGRGARAGGAT